MIASRRRLWLGGAVVVAALGFLVFQGLGNATVYFRTADEAVAQRRSLGTRRLRVEGTVVGGSVVQSAGNVAFLISNNNVELSVLHTGAPPEMFKPGIPVVLEGHFSGNTFSSDRILVKHSETYVADHPERVTTTVGTSGP
ncbi:MAG: cytochrome c maturation protein CcmE [Acidimicrobiales bacterium]